MNEQILILVFMATEAAHAFSAFMPSYFTVKKFAESTEDIAKLRSGYLPAVLFNLMLGAVVSAIIKSPLPLVFCLIVSLLMISLYENAMSEAQPARLNE